MKTRSYQFQTQWRKGLQHAVADALSRVPSSIPTRDDTLDEDDLQYAARAIRTCIQQDGPGGTCIHFADIKPAAAADVDYQRLVDAVLHGFPLSRRSLPACLVPYWNGREYLSVDSGIVLKGPRIVVPEALRARVLQDLHKSHQGLVHTKRRACQVVYWPKLTADINNLTHGCPSCREHQSSLPSEPLLNDRQPTLPFQCTSADHFTC